MQSSPTTEPAARPHLPWGGTDFVQYYVCGRLAREGRNPYDAEAARNLQRSLGRPPLPVATYAPPTTLLLFYPCCGFDFPTAIQANLAINVGLLAFCIIGWCRLLFPDQPGLILIGLTITPLWLPTLSVLGMGQNTLWVLAGATGWAWASVHGRTLLAGILLSAVFVKPHLGALILLFALIYAIRQRYWRTILGLFFTVIIWVGLTQVVMPNSWPNYVSALGQLPPPSTFHSATLDGWGRLTFGAVFFPVTLTVGLLFALLTGWAAIRCSRCTNLTFLSAVCCAAALCASPHAFSYDFVLLLPGFLAATGGCLNRRTPINSTLLTFWLGLNGWLIYSNSQAIPEVYTWWVPWIALVLTASQILAGGFRAGSIAPSPRLQATR